jgi:hypothetical protein
MPKREIDFDIFAEENREKIDKAFAEDAKLKKLSGQPANVPSRHPECNGNSKPSERAAA